MAESSCGGGGGGEEADTGIDPLSLTSMATQLLLMISNHVQTLASDWFLGIILLYNIKRIEIRTSVQICTLVRKKLESIAVTCGII